MAEINVRHGSGDNWQDSYVWPEHTAVHIEVTDLPTYNDDAEAETVYSIHLFDQSAWETIQTSENPVYIPTLQSVKFGGPAFTWDNVIFPKDTNYPGYATWSILIWDHVVGGYMPDGEVEAQARTWTFAVGVD